ncbi:hypothetical protein [Alkalihalobacillus sp. R86527]|uniref:hypothetical protein n=1 Tax=Alkalihalobacillus sp. R86527 TaxID=3093863 RepID=UPI00367126FE
MKKVWGFIETIAGVIVIVSIIGIILTVAENQGDGVYKMTERPPWLNYAGVAVVLTMIIALFAHVSRKSEGESVKFRAIQTAFYIIFVGGILTLVNLFR